MGSLIFVAIVLLLVLGAVSFVRGMVRQRAYRRERRRGESSGRVQSPAAGRAPKPPRAVPEGRQRLDTDGLVSLSIGTLLVFGSGVVLLARTELPGLFVIGLPAAAVGGALTWLYTDRG